MKMILCICCTLVFLILARLRFPLSKWILKIIKHRYSKSVLKLVRRFQRTDLRCRKAELDLIFLKYCFFRSFKVSDRSLKSSDTYKQCVRYACSKKKFLIRSPSLDKSELTLLKKHLKTSINVMDYAHICSIFLISNNKVLTKQKNIRDRKVIGLIKGKGIWYIYSQRVLIFFFLARTLKFLNTVVSLNYRNSNLWKIWTKILTSLFKRSVKHKNRVIKNMLPESFWV